MITALSRAGIALDEPHERHGLTCHTVTDDDHPADDPTIGWVNARTEDIDTAVKVAASCKWVLRAHWPTPRCRVCSGKGQVNGPDGVGLTECVYCDGEGRTNKPLVVA